MQILLWFWFCLNDNTSQSTWLIFNCIAYAIDRRNWSMYNGRISDRRSDRVVDCSAVMQFDCMLLVQWALSSEYPDVWKRWELFSLSFLVFHGKHCDLHVCQISLFTRIVNDVVQARFLEWSTAGVGRCIFRRILFANNVSFLPQFPNDWGIRQQIVAMQCFTGQTLHH